MTNGPVRRGISLRNPDEASVARLPATAKPGLTPARWRQTLPFPDLPILATDLKESYMTNKFAIAPLVGLRALAQRC